MEAKQQYKQKAANTEEEPQAEREFSKNPDDCIWFNRSKSGKGANLYVNDELYVSSVEAIKNFAAGQKDGKPFNAVKFTKMVPKGA